MIQREDFLLRLIRRMAAFLARILELKDQGQLEQALRTVDEAFAALLGEDRLWVRDLDAASIAALVGDAEHLLLYARLLKVEGELLEARAEFPSAQLAYARGLELLLIALERDGLDTPESRVLRQGLERRADPAWVAEILRRRLKR